MRLEGKVAVVTGAGSGIGRATARLFAKEGARVVATDLHLETARETLANLPASLPGSLALAADISDSAQVDDLFGEVAERFGCADILVNCAGVDRTPGDGVELREARVLARIEEMRRGEAPTTHPDQIADMSDAGWQRMLDINLSGPFYCCRAAVRLLVEAARAGSIINIASTAGLDGMGSGVHYAASKAGVIGLTKALARELGSRGIRVNAICPGPIDTPMVQGIPPVIVQSLKGSLPLGRVGAPEEVATAALFLATGDSSYFTGQAISPNGGLVMS